MNGSLRWLRSFFPSIGLGLWILLAGCGGKTPVDRIVLVTIDTLRADHLGSYGYPVQVSPFLDRLAREGILFENAISSSSHTSPSHASIMTGVYPKQHGVLQNLGRLPEDSFTVARYLQDAGFETAGFAAAPFLLGMEAGFEHFAAAERAQGWSEASTIVERATHWLEQLPRDSRYFLWIHLWEPHEWPRTPAGDQDGLARQAEGLSDEAFLEFLRTQHGTDPSWQTEVRTLAAIDRYDALIAEADRALESLYSELERKGHLDRSLWIVTADHGEGLGSHGHGGHGEHLYQEQIHVPLIFHWGDRRHSGRRIDTLIRHIDLFPTVAALAGLPLDGQLQREGRSFVPLFERRFLAGTTEMDERFAVSQRRPADAKRIARGWHPGDVLSIQNHRAKLILRTEGPDEFYLLDTDPLEGDDRAEQPSRESLQLRRKLLALNARMLSEAPEPAYLDGSFRPLLRSLGYIQ